MTKTRGLMIGVLVEWTVSASAQMMPGAQNPMMMQQGQLQSPYASPYGYPVQQIQGPPGMMPGQPTYQPPQEGERPADETRQALGCGPGNYGRLNRDGFQIEGPSGGSHSF